MKNVRQLAVVAVFGFPVFYVFWIIFVGTFSTHELLIGIVGSGLATAGVVVVNLEYPFRFAPTLTDVLSLWRVPWYLVSDTREIFVVAVEDLLGIKAAKSLFRIVPFDAGKKDNPRAAARRLLAVIYTTITPSTIVLGVNSNDHKMLLHQLERSPIQKMTKDLGAQV